MELQIEIDRLAIETFVKQQQQQQKSSNKKSTTIQVDSVNNMNSKILLNVPTIIETTQTESNEINEKMYSIKSIEMADFSPAAIQNNTALSTIKSESSKVSVSSLKKKNK